MSELQDILQDNVARMWQHIADPSSTHHTLLKQGSWAAKDFEACQELGLPNLLLSQAQGGTDQDFEALTKVLLEAGKVALALPLVSTIFARYYLSFAPNSTAHENVPTGSMAFGFADIHAHTTLVHWGGHSAIEGAVIVLTDEKAQATTRYLLSTKQLANVRQESYIDMINQHHIKVNVHSLLELCKNNAIPTATITMTPHTPALLYALAESALLSGALTKALELSCQYVIARKQFGKSLASFQAIQQQIAALAGDVAAVGSATSHAAALVQSTLSTDAPQIHESKLDLSMPAAMAVAIARTRAGLAVQPAINVSHQVHGAIGFTAEYPLQRYSKFLWSYNKWTYASDYWAHWLGHQALTNQQTVWNTLES